MRKRFAIGLLAAAIVVGLVAVRGHELLRFAIRQGAGIAGYDVSLGRLRVGSGVFAIDDLRVMRDALPLLSAARITIRYSLRDLLPGSSHRFGLLGVDAEGAKLTLTRFSNGGFNLALPQASASSGPQPPNSVPLRFTLRVANARIELREPSAYDDSARDVRIDRIDAEGSVDSAGVTRYRVGGAFEERAALPFTIAGRIDVPAGYAMHHATAAHFPLRALANYFAQSRDVIVRHGAARNFDAVVYALGTTPDTAPSYHVGLRLDVDGAALALSSLALPVEKIRARLHLIDGTFYVDDARAALAGIPLQIRGGVYDLTGALTGGAQLRIGVWGAGDLNDLRHAFTFTRDQPMSGKTTMGVEVAGPVNDPIIVARASAPHAFYRRLPFDGVSAGVVYHANVVALEPLRASYGGVQMGIRGTLHTGAHLGSELAVHVAGPADRLPYLDEMLGAEPIVVDASAIGRDLLFHVIGAAASARGVDRVAALLQMNPNGTARVDPFWLRTPRGNLEGAYLLDRPRSTSAFWLAAEGLHMRAPRYAAFPNLSLPQMPPIDGGIMNASIAGGGSGKHIVIGGLVGASQTSIAHVQFTHLQAALAGTLQQAPINLLAASGPWGTFNGRGEFSSTRFVAYGNYHGTFEGLQPFLGSAITGHGALRGTVAIAVEPQRIVVLGSNLAMPGATLRGVPVDRASLTLAIEGSRLHIYSAHAHAAGGDVVAAGSFSLRGPASSPQSNSLWLVANNLRASQLEGIGFPLRGGTLSATGDLRAGAVLPAFDGAVVVKDSRIAQFPIAGEGDVKLSGDAVTLRDMIGKLSGTYARVNGSIGALTSGSPTYALAAEVPAAPVARTLSSFGFPNYMTDGTFNARLQIGGRSISPTVSGAVAVPGGDVNGLPFIDASAMLEADRSGVDMRAGSVLVGTTAARFSAVARPQANAIHVNAQRADLSDFNNFFDTGDTLDGKGRLSIAAAYEGEQITSSGNIDVRGFRYRNYPIGDTRAVWTSASNVLKGTLAVGGSHGVLRARGSIGLYPGTQSLQTLERSRFDLSANVDDLDLSLWLPTLGMQALPLTGRAFGEATIHGRFPGLALQGEARIVGGSLGPLTLDTAAMRMHAAGRSVVIDSAELRTPELNATAAGRLGLGADTPLDLTVSASTDRLAKLVYDLSRLTLPISGSFESTLKVGGTYRAPTFAAGFDATGAQLYHIPIASLFGEVRLRDHSLELSNAGVSFKKGEATLAGSLPLSLSPLRLPADRPLSFDLDAVGLDPAIFDEVLRENTKLGGSIDAHIGIEGTLASPGLVGRISLLNGSYVSDLQRVPITGMVADLSFNHASARITRVFARAGSGTLTGSGTVDFPEGFSTKSLGLSLNAQARRARLDLPAYGSGALDAKLALTKRPGEIALLSGNVTLSDAVLPFASFVKAATESKSGGIAQIPLAFDIHAAAGRNVRVRGNGYGAGLDIGAAGSVQLAGTLAAPTLAGRIASTGGTLVYFDRAFRVQQASVNFNAADGVLPTISAVANTSVVNPDPDRARNPYGSAEVTVRVDGPIAGLKFDLQANPGGYSRDQILALIAPFGGFLNGISYSRQAMLARQQPGGITPLGSLYPIPNVALSQNSSITVGQEAFNILNAQFTAGLLAPVESTLGQGLGLSSVNLTLGYYGNVGVTATRLLGKTVSAVYAVTFGLPQIQSFGLIVQANPVTAASLNFFLQSGPTKLLQLPGAPLGYNASYLSTQPLIGNSGFSLTVQHFFW